MGLFMGPLSPIAGRLAIWLLLIWIAAAFTPTAQARFITPDTWDPWIAGVDINRYAYGGNDPINSSDPSGHFTGLADPRGANAEHGTPTDGNMHEVNRRVNSGGGLLQTAPGGMTWRVNRLHNEIEYWANQVRRYDPTYRGPSFIGPRESEPFAYDARTINALQNIRGRVMNDLARAKTQGMCTPENYPGAPVRAQQIQSILGSRTQEKVTTAVTETSEGINVVTSSSGMLSPAQRDALKANEIAGYGQPGTHAEINGMNAAREMGLSPLSVSPSRTACPGCASTLTGEGIQINNPGP
ncbi:hypothetical protein BH10PSE7_BH10PSE7_39530 [soil metagenome]